MKRITSPWPLPMKSRTFLNRMPMTAAINRRPGNASVQFTDGPREIAAPLSGWRELGLAPMEIEYVQPSLFEEMVRSEYRQRFVLGMDYGHPDCAQLLNLYAKGTTP